MYVINTTRKVLQSMDGLTKTSWPNGDSWAQVSGFHDLVASEHTEIGHWLFYTCSNPV